MTAATHVPAAPARRRHEDRQFKPLFVLHARIDKYFRQSLNLVQYHSGWQGQHKAQRVGPGSTHQVVIVKTDIAIAQRFCYRAGHSGLAALSGALYQYHRGIGQTDLQACPNHAGYRRPAGLEWQ